MSTLYPRAMELDQYIRNRIQELTRAYNATVATMYSAVLQNIRNAQRFNRQSAVNALILKFNNDVARLRQQLAFEIQRVQNHVPSDFEVAPVQRKRALLIGINYLNTPYALAGCIDDAKRMQTFLEDKKFSCQVLTDETTQKPTKATILSLFAQMLASAQAGDLLFFYFSGHGSYTYDRNGDEADKRDEMIVSSDLQGVLDDELKALLSKHLKEGVTLVGLFDSCHSGTMFDLKYSYLDGANCDSYIENSKVSECAGNVLMISGCMDAQTSAEAIIDSRPQGAMSWSFLELLKDHPSLSWRELLKGMRDILKTNQFTQVPSLSTDSFYDIDQPMFV